MAATLGGEGDWRPSSVVATDLINPVYVMKPPEKNKQTNKMGSERCQVAEHKEELIEGCGERAYPYLSYTYLLLVCS